MKLSGPSEDSFLQFPTLNAVQANWGFETIWAQKLVVMVKVLLTAHFLAY